ncbi:probable disease resistance protein At4g27220 [Lycium ferocissimum]|uniref:probable disease resistance protein At4g27220 n=1 Tax=Lycium ferocissimum TaxID=112874 RepID=UPI0028163501|nr:probable disease resistance protein At4g27220 [Lycium ferocissimum]XP_059280486.1 probable disease resistance protein At4g27220 [Lycium ferocissimum]XP_059280487.1 probable disease resistance protein At4g27220 [Lycium ferocissimum]XP_059280488.1 probable disease resistance protein At4g27220 [Lycium ferocissimum]XP_059280489.1 probable disease resistance protein At4g27220 [Lycium ferocissimum]XP_059280490.1 probable disease resistance protein At4g27220 [Lycium ferocissimum]XP_059280491.1 pr
MEALSSIIKEKVWDPYMGLEEKAEILRSKMKVLISRGKDVMSEAKDAEQHSSKKRKTEVDNWQSNVQTLENKFKCFDQEVEQSSKFSRIGLSNRANKIHKEVEDLLDQGKFSEGILLNINEEKVQPLVTTNLKGKVFEQSLKEVIEYSLSEVSKIGIWGMGGVGKTTLAKHIYNYLLKESRFSGHVYWVTVSQDLSITKMQRNIAKTFGLDLSSEDDEEKMAAQLFESLKRIESFVLILDDVWTHFDVTKVGIPLEIGGGKMIITSRSSQVCDRIGCQKKVKVATLLMTESWELFVETLGHSGDLPMEIEEIAKRMTKKCDGLPLGLITMAASMRGVNDIFEWRDAFEEFTESCMQMENMNNEVFSVLRFSYNRLREPRLQKCFLYCCLYPEDFQIERDELIHRFIVEGLLVRRNNRRAEFDQGHAVLNKLERACLLESVSNYGGERTCVRMHDLVRQMALRIARDEFKWMVKPGAQLREIPEEQEWSEDLDKVSLMENDIKEISQPLSNVCPRLTTFSLRGNRSLSQVVDPFLVQMPGLRVLDLSYTAIQQLPSSVTNLASLSALLLRCCTELRFLPPLDKLKNLTELDLYFTNIKEVPQGLASLVNLRCLDMRTEEKPFNKPVVDILARLSNLQFLSIHFAIRAEDLQGMRKLEVFHGVFVDVCSFNGFVKHRQSCRRPSFFEIALEPKQSSSLGFNFIRYDNKVILKDLVLTGDNVEMLCYDKIEEERDVTLLPLDTQELVIDHCDILTLGNSLLDAIPSLIQSKDLRAIHIIRCRGLEFLMRLSCCSSMGERMMGDHELTLRLSCLDEFSGLVKLELGEALPAVGTFPHLCKLQVFSCNKMKKLIPRWLLQYLLNLTEIIVDGCAEMEEIITEDEEEQAKQCASSASSSSPFPSNESRSIKDNEVVLPKLQSVQLNCLPKLKSIYKGRMTCGSIQRITVLSCWKLKRLPFTLPLLNGQPSAPPALQEISMDHEAAWQALEWDHPEYKSVLHPFFKPRW